MTRVSLELVPRSRASLDADLAAIAAQFPSVDTVNIPDLLRFELRSWEACGHARRKLPRAIPHLRAMDFAPERVEPLLAELAAHGLGEVLVVRGDPPQEPGRRVFPTRSHELIEALKRARPELTVYAALDPYRASLRDELDWRSASATPAPTASSVSRSSICACSTPGPTCSGTRRPTGA